MSELEEQLEREQRNREHSRQMAPRFMAALQASRRPWPGTRSRAATDDEEELHRAITAEAEEQGFADPADAARLLDRSLLHWPARGGLPINIAGAVGQLRRDKPYLLAGVDAPIGRGLPAKLRPETVEAVRAAAEHFGFHDPGDALAILAREGVRLEDAEDRVAHLARERPHLVRSDATVAGAIRHAVQRTRLHPSPAAEEGLLGRSGGSADQGERGADAGPRPGRSMNDLIRDRVLDRGPRPRRPEMVRLPYRVEPPEGSEQ